MREFAIIAGYFVATALSAAAIAPPMFWVGRAMGEVVPGLGFLVETEFQRYFNRCFLIAAVALLWPAARLLRVRSLSDFGLQRNPQRGLDAAFGLVVPMVFLWMYGVLLLALDFYRMKDPLPWGRLPSAAGTAIAVGIVEELFFRGALFGLLRRAASTRFAVLSLSALFSILHFLKAPEESIAADAVGWTSGFAMVPLAFHQFAQPGLVLGGFVTLFVLSLILCDATLRTRSLWLAIGLHAGIVFGARSFNILAQRLDERLPWVGPDLRIGLLPVVVLGGLWGAIRLYLLWRERSLAPRTGRSAA